MSRSFFVLLVIAVSIGYWTRVVASYNVATLPDGGIYQGDIVEGVLQGKGSIDWPDGDRYEGDFVGGLMHGQGTLTYSEGDQYEGTFTHGEFTGVGQYTNDGGGVYKGEFNDWLFEGKGEYIDSQGNVFRGEFKDNQLMGDGVYEGIENTRYEGEFSYNEFDGKGIYLSENGDRYEGEFQYGKFHGEGIMYLHEEKFGVDSYAGKWKKGYLIESDVDAFVDRHSERIEKALYAENQLLQESLDLVQNGKSGAVEAFFLGIAGDGKQKVFMREVNAVKSYFSQRYGNKDKHITLINDRDLLGEKAMATQTSIRKSLNRMGEVMNKDEDVLFLYLTSHGSSEHEFVLSQRGIRLAYLPADELAGMLSESGIKWKVIFISACYSGGFIPLLQDENTLVMTSSAQDRTSFGCSDASKMTYFGKALFNHSLKEENNYTEAFESAKKLINQWEDDQEIESHSNPQISVGKNILAKLKSLDEARVPTEYASRR